MRPLSYILALSTEKHISDRLGSSIDLPCIKPIRDSSESSSQAEAFITNRPCSPSTPNVHCHRMHSISYLRQQMQRCISFPIPGNRCRTSGLYNCAVSPALGRTSSTHSFIFSSGCPSCFSVDRRATSPGSAP